ncbi:ATP-dependent DNA helicase [Pantanalinema rosaneae CENA516]|uniref:ATP-dependent DNA helicase n=1 Tax=Pantanalinema rosaneae TaxID=1620701 RepID=UPI003D6EBA22
MAMIYREWRSLTLDDLDDLDVGTGQAFVHGNTVVYLSISKKSERHLTHRSSWYLCQNESHPVYESLKFVIEVEVHQQLRAFLRQQGESYWPHHLTMARLVARALRLGRSALLQTGAFSGYHERYRLSYLVPVLMWQEAVILVAPESVHQRLLMVEIPQLQQWIRTTKPIQTGDRFPHPHFQGLLLTTPAAWLSDRLLNQGRFPDGIPTVLDGVDDLEGWTRTHLTTQIQPSDWDTLMLACPEQADLIRDVRVQLTKTLFQHPTNPYECYLIDEIEQAALTTLFQTIAVPAPAPDMTGLPATWNQFGQAFFTEGQLLWAELIRRQGQFSLHCSPADIATNLQAIWSRQPVVLIGGALDLDADACAYRQRLGLDIDLTSLKFSPDRQEELIHLYLPDRLPMPNTPQFQAALLQEMHTLLRVSSGTPGLIVLLVGDTPLKAQVGSVLASEFGSRVQVERTCLDENGVLVTGWEFWRQHQRVLPAPHLLAIATLPIPSLEHPLVAGRVAHYKRLRQDWFRLYLLPTALSELQRAIAPVRERQGVVALLDSRVVHRSYGQQILSALHPLARISYLDASLFSQPDYFIVD